MEVSKVMYPNLDKQYWDIFKKPEIVKILNELIRITCVAFKDENEQKHFTADISVWSDDGDVVYSKDEFTKHFLHSSTYNEVKISSTYPQKQFILCFSIKPPYTKSFIFINSTSHTLPEIEDILLEVKAFIEDLFNKRINKISLIASQNTNIANNTENPKDTTIIEKPKSPRSIGQYVLAFLEIIKGILKLFSS